MHSDLEHLESPVLICSDVCIVGAGIAGLVLAKRLADAGTTVTLLEAGGLEQEERSQALYLAEMIDGVHEGTTQGRFRTFGGSSTRWGGQLLAYPDDVFCPVEGSPSEAWPILPAEIEPYYAEVLRIFGITPLPFHEELFPAIGETKPPARDGFRVRYSRWSPFSMRNLAQTIGREVLAHPKVQLVIHANVIRLDGKDGAISAARMVDYQGREFTVTADKFVVCSGTVESSRLLLLSPDVPNAHGQIGLGFNDHIAFGAGELQRNAIDEMVRLLGPFFVDGVLYTPKIEATSELQREHRLLNVMAHFVIVEPDDSGMGAVRNLLTSLQRKQVGQALTKNLIALLRGLPDVLRFAWSFKMRKRRLPSSRAVVRLNIDLEQVPGGDRRIALSDEVDALGVRKAQVRWRVDDAERETVRKYAALVRSYLEELGMGDIRWDPRLATGEEIPLADTYHPMGGLRMGTDPAVSVVDTDLKVHGTTNLYAATCGVFPAGGSSNPTFTLMALTMRLADHLLGGPR